MTDRLAGICLPNAQSYGPWRTALSENYIDIEDALGSAESMYDEGTLPFIHVMFHSDRQPDASIQNIASGDYDHLIEDWFMRLLSYCATGRTAVVVYLPEMNGNWCVYATDDYSQSAFITAFRDFVQRGRDMGLDDTMVKWCWAPNDTGWDDLKSWYPGDSYVDICGSSAYNWGGIFEGEPWEWPAELFDRYVLELRAFTAKPIVITQTGAGLNDHQQREWVDRMTQYVDLYTNIEGVIYYNELMFALGDDCNWNSQTAALNATRPDHWFEEDNVPQHTAMQWLPDALMAAGVNVIELDGWKEAQGNYYWTDIDSGGQSYEGEPTCYMIHHTAGTSATPVVKTSGGTWSKANCWAGLYRDGKLYQTGGGIPTVMFTSAGPARVSSGYGHGPTLRDVADDVRVPWDQPNSDTDMAANRYAWNVETVAAGDGSALDPGVEHALAVMGTLIADRFGWSPWRSIGHLTWTKRKIDPFWDNRTDVIVRIQDTIAEMMNDGTTPPPIDPEEPMEDQGRNQLYVKQGMSGQDVEYWQVRIIQAVESIAYYGNSNKAFIEAEGPASLVFKEWNQALTDYFSSWTQRNSYGIGATERVMVENAVAAI